MERAATEAAAGGSAALAAPGATDHETLRRVVAGLRARMAGVDPLSRHERLCLPADSMERRTVTLLRNARRGGAAVTGRPRSESIARMEADGTMDIRRQMLREWFADHPDGTPAEAVREFDWTFADHMVAVADAIWMDLGRGARLR